jgi:hypothetical protein
MSNFKSQNAGISADRIGQSEEGTTKDTNDTKKEMFLFRVIRVFRGFLPCFC